MRLRTTGEEVAPRCGSARWAPLAGAVLAAGLVIACASEKPTTPEPSPTPLPAPSPTPAPAATPPQPNPLATPDVCPVLTRWSSGIHNMTDANSQPISFPIFGGHVVVDSTPLFQGRPCNAEHDHCGGRKCEDPRGGVWALMEGESPAEARTNGYQFRIGPLVLGPHRWRVCPRRDAQDMEGQPVFVAAGACTEGAFTVTEAPPE